MYSGYRSGGNAEILIEVDNRDELKNELLKLKNAGINWHVLGMGYNTLISDKGIDGAIIRLKDEFCKVKAENASIIAGAGIPMNKLLRFCIENDLEGFEFAAGIPGTLGGSIINNSGANKKSIANCIGLIEIFNTDTFKYGEISPDDACFGYRESFFAENMIITGAIIDLKRGNKINIIKKIKNNINIKTKNQPVTEKSCGCVFKNPVKGNYSAAELIDMSGLKGSVVGDAEVSRQHANFIINKKNASSSDIWELIKKIRETVVEKFDVFLELEINLLGEGFD